MNGRGGGGLGGGGLGGGGLGGGGLGGGGLGGGGNTIGGSRTIMLPESNNLSPSSMYTEMYADARATTVQLRSIDAKVTFDTCWPMNLKVLSAFGTRYPADAAVGSVG